VPRVGQKPKNRDNSHRLSTSMPKPGTAITTNAKGQRAASHSTALVIGTRAPTDRPIDHKGRHCAVTAQFPIRGTCQDRQEGTPARLAPSTFVKWGASNSGQKPNPAARTPIKDGFRNAGQYTGRRGAAISCGLLLISGPGPPPGPGPRKKRPGALHNLFLDKRGKCIFLRKYLENDCHEGIPKNGD